MPSRYFWRKGQALPLAGGRRDAGRDQSASRGPRRGPAARRRITIGPAGLPGSIRHVEGRGDAGRDQSAMSRMPATCRAAVPLRQDRCRWRDRPRGPRCRHSGKRRQHQREPLDAGDVPCPSTCGVEFCCYERAARVMGTPGKPRETRNLRIRANASGSALGPIITSAMLLRSRGWIISSRGRLSGLTIGKAGFLRKFRARSRISF
jgi:hypothetical protein